MFTVETGLREQNVRDIDLKLGFPIVERLAFGDHRGMLLDEMPTAARQDAGQSGPERISRHA